MAGNRRSAPIETQIFASGFVVVLAAILFLFLAGDRASAVIDDIFKFSTNQLGAVYIWFTLFCFGVELYLAFGKYGKVRFGGPDARPEFTRLSWVAMFFCAGIGTALMAWASKEWAYHFVAPPFDVEPMSVKRRRAGPPPTGSSTGARSAGCFTVSAPSRSVTRSTTERNRP